MTKLTETQRALLARAAADAEGGVDAPEDAKLSRALIKHGLAISLPVTGGGGRLVITNAGRALLTPDQPQEGQGDAEGAGEAAAAAAQGGSTPSGQSEGEGSPESEPACGSLEPVASPETSTEAPTNATAPADAARSLPGGKLGKLVELLQRPSGATLEEMVAATGWQTHSVRGAMSAGLKKKLGLTIASAKTDGTRVYSLIGG